MWLITLLGAEISYALSVHHQRRQGRALDGFSHALLWLYQLWIAQLAGEGITLEKLINASDQPFTVDIGVMLRQLADVQLIQVTRNGHFILSRDLTHITLYELVELLPYRLPNIIEISELPIAHRWHDQIRDADSHLQQTLKINLDELFRHEA